MRWLKRLVVAAVPSVTTGAKDATAERDESKTWRLINTGRRRAAENLALNRALLEAHQDEGSPHTLRFLRFKPCVLVGFHQNLEQELKLEACEADGVDFQRRVTGGGAIYFDETQLGWELYLDKKVFGSADMSVISRRICEAAADGISRLGVNAKFRPRNDIEVDGKKISGTGGAFDGDSILYQGTLLLDFDVSKMLAYLNIPAEKLSDKAVASAAERVTSLKALLGEVPDDEVIYKHLTDAFSEEFGVSFDHQSFLLEGEKMLFDDAMAEIDTQEWIYQANRDESEAPTVTARVKTQGGLIEVNLLVDTFKKRIKQAWISGDFFVSPARLIPDLEGALRDTTIADMRKNVETFFAEFQQQHPDSQMLMLTPDSFIEVIEQALSQVEAEPVA